MRSVPALCLAIGFAIGPAACSSSKEPATSAGSATGPGSASAMGSGSASATGSGSASTTGSGSAYQALGKKPANARRPTAPPSIEARALAAGTRAPMFEVTDATGAPWRLADALSKHAKVILVFYRGDW